jgi:hypothetical protein
MVKLVGVVDTFVVALLQDVLQVRTVGAASALRYRRQTFRLKNKLNKNCLG